MKLMEFAVSPELAWKLTLTATKLIRAVVGLEPAWKLVLMLTKLMGAVVDLKPALKLALTKMKLTGPVSGDWYRPRGDCQPIHSAGVSHSRVLRCPAFHSRLREGVYAVRGRPKESFAGSRASPG